MKVNKIDSCSGRLICGFVRMSLVNLVLNTAASSGIHGRQRTYTLSKLLYCTNLYIENH